MVSSLVRNLEREKLGTGKSEKESCVSIFGRRVGCVKIFVSYDNTHQRSSTVKEALYKQVDKMTQPVDISQTFSLIV